jgi:type IV secretion system protein VirB5
MEERRVKRTFKNTLMAGVMIGGSLGAAQATGIPVVDVAALAKHIEQVITLTKQLENAREQLSQLQELHGSLNKLTNMGDIAKILNDPAVRRALPDDFGKVEGLLKGNPGLYNESYNRHLEENTYYKPQDANDFYAKELERTSKRNAGQMTVAEQMYKAASKRVEGIDELRKQIGKSKDAKETLDLQARLQAESAYLQTDVLRMEALKSVQEAQVQVDQQREIEERRQTSKKFREYLK